MTVLEADEIVDEKELMLDEYDLIASICRDSLWEFVKEFWGEIIEEPMVENWHMPYLCGWLQKIAERVFKREPSPYDLLINIAPGTSKSTIVSVMFPIWCWIREPWIQTICGSYGHDLALDLSTKGRDVLWSEKFKACFPELEMSSTQNAKTWYMNINGGWRFATSTGGAVTGKHGHIIIVDDPVDPHGAESFAEIDAANKWLTDVLPKRKVQQASTVTIMIMQRLSKDDPSGLWLSWKKKGISIKRISIPAELRPGINPIPLGLKRYYKDGLMDPVRLPKDVLEKQESISEFSYSGQYLQNPVPRGGGMFKTSKLKIEVVDKYPKEMRLVRYWDKAGTAGGGAYTVGVLMGVDRNKHTFVLDVVRGQWGAFVRESIIKQTAELDGKKVIIKIEQEPGSGGKESAESTVRNLSGFRVSADKVGQSDGNKENRAEPYASQVNGGHVTLRKADWNEIYIDELKNFSKISKYKDQVDGSSGAFNTLMGKRKRFGVVSTKKFFNKKR